MKLNILFLLSMVAACDSSPKAALYPQYPSPMVDYTRAHKRINLDSITQAPIAQVSFGDVECSLWANDAFRDSANVLIHFHGDSRVALFAIQQQTHPWVLVHSHWGGGSSAYSRPLREMGSGVFMDSLFKEIQSHLPHTTLSETYLSSWSAGYGATRSLIGNPQSAGRISGILLMDGLHCSYSPERTGLAQGGTLDSTQMHAFLEWARWAAGGQKHFVITHSSVFPGTYASTTETAEYLLQSLKIPRRPLLQPGPMGMQQSSLAEKGNFRVLSFAGNSAPDHVDHFHGMGSFVRMLP